MNRIFYILIPFFFIFSNCNINTDFASSKKEYTVISLERTACYGTCPIYKIDILNTGKGTYIGKQFVKYVGSYNFLVKKEMIDDILKKAETINFFQMQDKYTDKISDLPTTITFINNNKCQKKIINYYGAPKRLKELEKLIDSCIDYKKIRKIQ